jgi:hypothetical protein
LDKNRNQTHLSNEPQEEEKVEEKDCDSDDSFELEP